MEIRYLQVVPRDRYVTVLPLRDEPMPAPSLGIGQPKPSTFKRYSQKHEAMTEKQKDLANRMARHLSKSQSPKPKVRVR